ncbi:methyltransferase domain-containing protein [candidate division GN15 bacterium]|nr:methyltransferase domain-containing protein [candidate division GN15 bacterium]
MERSDEEKRRFDEFYDETKLSFGAEPSAWLREQVEAGLPGGRALDLGCGDGRNTLFLLAHGYEVTAIDLSQVGLDKLVSLARRQGNADRLTTVQSDVRDFTFPTDHFDMVVAVTLFDHLPGDDVRPVIHRAIASLKDDAILFVKAHTTEDPGHAREAGASELSDMIHHYFAPNELLDLTKDTCRVIRYEELREEDTTHGRPHDHAFAYLLAKKRPAHPKAAGR